ncbi:MAG: extracellular solute-binding protein [Christensenellales bacterium]|jgi:putative aldouronate transport system substrate-binding protein
MKRLLVLILALLLALVSFTVQADSTEDLPTITITAIYYSAEVPQNDIVDDMLKDITGYDTEINWVPTMGYGDKINTMLASDSMTMITVVTDLKSSSYLNAVRDGLFWTLNDDIGDYENISRIGEARFNNVRLDGNIMGIPRGRDLVRQGFIYRKDWADEAGLDRPTTIEEVDNMIRTFAAREETSFGLTIGAGAGYPEGVQYLAIYNGAPNGYGYDSKGNFTHMWLTDEFQEAVEMFATWYADGMLNKNFIEVNAEDAKKFINTEETGFLFIFTDDIGNRFADLYVKNPSAELWYGLELNGRTFGTAGFNGAMVMSKTAVPNEEMLGHILTFIDRLGSPDWQTVIGSGVEGYSYDIVDGFAVQSTQEQTDWHAAYSAQYGQVNCYQGVLMPSITPKFIPAIEALNAERLLYVDTTIMNPTTPFVSETWTLIGETDLNPIMYDAINKYIMGQITTDEYKAQQQRWLDYGGADVIEEFRAQIEK